MSGLNSSSSNIPDSSGRPFATSFSPPQSALAPGFHHSVGVQGLHNIQGSFNVLNMPGSLPSRNAAMSGVPQIGIQQPGGSISSGRFGSNNLPFAMSQVSHGSSNGQSGVTNRGGINIAGNPGFSNSMNGVGSIPGISSSTGTAGNRNAFPGLSSSAIFGNVGRMTSSMGNIVGGSIGRNISSGGLSVANLASRVNLAANNGVGSLGLQGQSSLMSGMLQQGPHIISMLGNSYPTSGGPLSQNQVQAGNNPLTLGMLNDVNSNDNSPFDMNDFPQLSGRPSSSEGPQGQFGTLRKQGAGVSSIVQQSQEFSIQNEDFPALPGFKGGSSVFPMELHQKDQLHENVSMMQPQHFPMARSSGLNLGGSYASTRQQQQQHATSVSNTGVPFVPGNNQDLLHFQGSDLLFPSSHDTYHSQIQNSGHPSIGLRQLSSSSPASGIGSYEQLMQQYQHPQSQSQFRLQQLSAQQYRDQDMRPVQVTQAPPDPYSVLALSSLIKNNDPDLAPLALGIDLTTLGLNLNSNENLYKTFGSPWSNEPSKGDPEYCIPSCYNIKPPPQLQQRHFQKFQTQTLFYIFYSMPKDEGQVYAACELYSRGWFYHRDNQLWFTRVANIEPLVKTNTHERGSYLCFDPSTWDLIRKDNFVLQYESVERKPTPPSPSTTS